MQNKRTAGVTLIELLLAVGILAVIVAPVLGMFVVSTQASATAQKLTIASFTAQMRMEELVGLTESELRTEFDPEAESYENTIELVEGNYNGYWVRATVVFGYQGSSSLALATVAVRETETSQKLATYENVLRVE